MSSWSSCSVSLVRPLGRGSCPVEAALRESLRGVVAWVVVHPFVSVAGAVLMWATLSLVWRFLVLRVERAALFGGRSARPSGAWWLL